MSKLYKKVSRKEKIVGWYSIENDSRENNLGMNRFFFGYTENPIILVIKKNKNGYLIDAFLEKQKFLSKETFFETIPIKIGMLKSEEICIRRLINNNVYFQKISRSIIFKKWTIFLLYFFKGIRKIFKKNLIRKDFYEANSSELNTLLIFIKSVSFSSKKKMNSIRKNIFSLYLSIIQKLIFIIENVIFSFFSKNFKYIKSNKI